MSTSSFLERITPEVAAAIIGSQNGHNRTLRDGRVERYAEAMKRGQWRTTGQGLTFDTDGNLIDGQHRLHAVVLSGVTVEMVVVRDADPTAFTVIDTGLNRRAADTLQLAGLPNPTHSAPIVRLSIAWECDIATDSSAVANLITNDDIMEYAEKHRGHLIEATKAGSNIYANVGGNRAAMGAVLLAAIRMDAGACFGFSEAVLTGEGLALGDPRLALRNLLVRMNASSSTYGRRKLPTYTHLFTYAKAWNAWARGKQVRAMRVWNTDEPRQTLVAPRPML